MNQAVMNQAVKLQLVPIMPRQFQYWDGEAWSINGKEMSYAEAKEIRDTLAETEGIASIIVDA